eukprot:CAMPEP_0175131284 /NCGR_PEP_ID=MMETSP0087-20121206/6458_1 /TAXON_ID=136419 /ORGANISM="Unknown Unknown, Strain D1" /LENGTH=429 /DNA_ID=CAMNT_0016413559 /DNA_START=214 /DNA_END=1502 /DNA_ORIENTATION=+
MRGGLYGLWFHFGVPGAQERLSALFAGKSTRPCVEPSFQRQVNPDIPIKVLTFQHQFQPDEMVSKIFTQIFTGSWAFEQRSHFGMNFTRPSLDSCPVRCEFLSSLEDPSQADVILFDFTRFGNVFGGQWCSAAFPWPLRHPLDHKAGHFNSRILPSWTHPHNAKLNYTIAVRPAHQLWGNFHYEQPSQFPVLIEPYFLDRVDFHVNWRQDADVPITDHCDFAAPFDDSAWRAPVNMTRKTKLVAAVISRCDRAQKRSLILKELMKYVHVHSFGSCDHNADLEEGVPAGSGGRSWTRKLTVLGEFKFVLAFENADYLDWVTEKLPHAMLAGSLPVFWGASNVRDYLPSPHSAVIVSEFPSVQALAQHLLELDKNDTKYLEYFEWKKKDFSPSFIRQRKNCVRLAQCRICQYYHSRLRNTSGSCAAAKENN